MESIYNVFGMITTVVYSGQLSDHLFRMGSVISLIAHRTGRKRILVFVDEILKIRNSEIIAAKDLLLKLAAQQDLNIGLYSLLVSFSALKVDIFACVKSWMNRRIISTPLPIVDMNDTSHLISVSTKSE